MFSVTKTEMNVFPLCTKKVCPTKSGVTIERRDQVLIGFFAPELFILSIFSRRCDSRKGPFFNDLAINVKFSPPCHPGRQPRDPVALALRFRHGILRLRFDPLRMTSCYTFFFPRLLSKMNRSLGLCFVRVLNPFANCPHGLTG